MSVILIQHSFEAPIWSIFLISNLTGLSQFTGGAGQVFFHRKKDFENGKNGNCGDRRQYVRLLPQPLSFEGGATLPYCGMLAWDMLVTAGDPDTKIQFACTTV